jgi:hypothetical protein
MSPHLIKQENGSLAASLVLQALRRPYHPHSNKGASENSEFQTKRGGTKNIDTTYA